MADEITVSECVIENPTVAGECTLRCKSVIDDRTYSNTSTEEIHTQKAKADNINPDYKTRHISGSSDLTSNISEEKNKFSLPNGCVKPKLPEPPENCVECTNMPSSLREEPCAVSDAPRSHESLDSGLGSCPDTSSDTKSPSSSPGLSTVSSNHDLCDASKNGDSNKSVQSTGLCETEKQQPMTDVLQEVTDSLAKTDISDDLAEKDIENGIEYVVYESELQMPDIMRLITKDLSEPYSIYTYRYFIHNWPKLCFLAMDGLRCVGAIVCKLDVHKKMARRGYIAMLAIDQEYRRRRIGSHLVLKAIRAMMVDDCDEVVLETEITNKAALRLYENLGFVRDKRLFRYYLNGVDALRLKLWLR